MRKPKVLLVEDSPSLAEIYKQYLKSEDVALYHASSIRDATLYLQNAVPMVILLDLKLDDGPGEKVLEYVKQNELPSSVIVITAHGSVDTAVKMLRDGAADFLQKPIEAARLLTTVRTQLEKMRLKNLVDSLSEDIGRDHFQGFVGASAEMQSVYQIITAVSSSDAAVFVTGESGTGKEVCAQAIHNCSARQKAPFVAINCGAIPKDLMESEIFGHQKGAFTGATSDRQGAASEADGGTLFLDEIGEMDLSLQTKLLRFIQTGMIKKVGGNKDEKVNVRFICATNRDPLKEIEEGRFREDLYYRLNVLPMHLPALRERGNDIILLAEHFLKIYSEEEGKQFQQLSDEVKSIFLHYPWPGNVRQLQNVLRNIVVLHNVAEVAREHLPPAINPSVSSDTSSTPLKVESHSNNHNIAIEETSEIRPLAIVEREAIERAIAFCDGNIPKAAALLDVSPSTIYRKKQAWGDE